MAVILVVLCCVDCQQSIALRLCPCIDYKVGREQQQPLLVAAGQWAVLTGVAAQLRVFWPSYVIELRQCLQRTLL